MVDATFVILGATGDLTKRYILPAIYRLVKEKKIKKCCIIGVARRELKIEAILNESKSFVKKINKSTWSKIEKAAYYHQLNFYEIEDYKKLGQLLNIVEKKHHLSGNRLFYLATLPNHFDVITNYLAKTEIAKESDQKWSRLVYEKPFGEDLLSARKINACISRVFKENQVFRIDHYLGKELVGNITMLRFTNRIFEPLWNNNHIENIQVVFNEKIGVEGRGEYYDKYGALKDVLQNHVLQMMALTTMNVPKNLSGDYIRDEKAKILKASQVDDVLLGQYENYQWEQDIPKNSQTETFAAVKLLINNHRWSGVPIYLKTGKALDEKKVIIHIQFKRVECLLSVCPNGSNHLTIRVQPDEGFELELFAKVPGEGDKIEPVKMNFSHQCITKQNSPEAYQILLSDVIKGDQSLFVRNDEIESAWEIIDKINAKKLKVYSYPKGSKGPKEMEDFEKKHNMRWAI